MKIGNWVKGLRDAFVAASEAGSGTLEKEAGAPEDSGLARVEEREREDRPGQDFLARHRFTERAALCLLGQVYTEHDLRDTLGLLVEKYGSQKGVADWLCVSKAYLGDILHGRRPISDGMAAKMGWKKMEVFVRDEASTETQGES